jgi:hypothetical protein
MRLVWRSFGAIRRARIAILTIAAAYGLSVLVGIGMVTSGNAFALERRDEIVGGAQSSAILEAYDSGDRLRAALLDFASNLVLGGATSTVAGVGLAVSYPIVAYRGWVGGIVSVDGSHRSRLADPGAAFYYIVALILQLIPYSLAGGMGVYLGVGAWRELRHPTRAWLGLPIDRLRDVALAYVAIVPLFLIASLWEFLV